MDANNLNISKIETYLNGILDNVVSNNTYFGYMPDASIVKSSDWQDMVMVEIPNGIRDMDAYGQGTILVRLYARPLESGRKNVAKLSELETKLNAVIVNAKDKNYQISRRMTFTDYDADVDWHCNVVEIILKVF